MNIDIKSIGKVIPGSVYVMTIPANTPAAVRGDLRRTWRMDENTADATLLLVNAGCQLQLLAENVAADSIFVLRVPQDSSIEDAHVFLERWQSPNNAACVILPLIAEMTAHHIAPRDGLWRPYWFKRVEDSEHIPVLGRLGPEGLEVQIPGIHGALPAIGEWGGPAIQLPSEEE